MVSLFYRDLHSRSDEHFANLFFFSAQTGLSGRVGSAKEEAHKVAVGRSGPRRNAPKKPKQGSPASQRRSQEARSLPRGVLGKRVLSRPK